jgi:hypothetical protein
MSNLKKLLEAATIKARAQAAARALKLLLADKSLPDDLRNSVESLHTALKKKWAELETETSTEAARSETLNEASNLGDWVFARMHTDMIMRVDDLLASDRLNFDEYQAALHAVELAANTFRTVMNTGAPGVFARSPWQDVTSHPVTESDSASGSSDEFLGDAIELIEKAVRRDGTIPIKIIQPGWGSSGFYPANVLERDGPRIFTKGLHMYWDHPTSREDAERPERQLDDLAAVLTSDARWADGPRGAGLYADALVMEHYRAKVDELAPHIGISIRALGTARQGDAEGKQGAIIDSLTAGRSIDFVTAAGAGGEILSLFESARKPSAVSATSTGDVSIQKPIKEVASMDPKELQDANAALQRQLDEANAANARAREALILREAKDHVNAALVNIDLPAITRVRLVESLAKIAPVKDGALDKDTYNAQIAEAVKAEVKYLSEAVGLGRIRGMGGSSAQEGADDNGGIQADEETEKTLVNAFKTMGLSESTAKVAAAGRS